jgi:hypothetical protein
LQAVLSPHHALTASVNIFPLNKQFADLRSLVPQTATSDYGQNGVSAGLLDAYQFGSGGLLSTAFRYTRFDGNAHGQGPLDMLVTPEGWRGNFFNTWSRSANGFELVPTYQFPARNWLGRHELKVGVDASRRSYSGTSVSRPVNILREDGTLAEQIAFQGPGQLHAADNEISEFVEDHWVITPHLAVDAGARLTSQTIGRDAAVGPHIGIAYSPGQDQKTVIRANAGIFYGHFPLLAADFIDNQTRVVSFFDATGTTVIGTPTVFQNAFINSGSDPNARIVPGDMETSPRTRTLSVEVEREIHQNVNVRVGYLNSPTTNLVVMNPLASVAGSSGAVLGLASTGVSRYSQVEATVHARIVEHDDLTVSYVRSRARGDLNTLSDIFVPFLAPVIHPNATGILPADVPNRVLAIGSVELPRKFFVSPVADVHTGLPFSNFDALQNYVGVPNGLRYPTFFSLDLRFYREFVWKLPFTKKPANKHVRLGVYTLNVTNHQNPRDIYNVTTSPNFGTFLGSQGRIDGLVLDFLD